jgi:hypothetical protein
MQQLRADMALQEGDRPADGGRRPSQPTPRPRQTALVERGDKHPHRFDTIHEIFRTKQD